MTGEVVDQKFITNRLLLVAGGILLVVAGMLALLHHSIDSNIRSAQRNFVTSGETPVVLVGDSLIFRAGVSGFPWRLDPSTGGYHTSPDYSISWIIVKANASSETGEGDPATDALRINVAGGGWEIDEFTDGSTTVPVTTVTPYGATAIAVNLQNPATGALCPVLNGSDIVGLKYSSQQNCPGAGVKFTRVDVKVSYNGKQVTLGSLYCLDASGNTGRCRIVFRK